MRADKLVNRAVGVVPAVIIAVVAIAELAAAVRYPARAPTAADWQRAHDIVAAGRRDGELVVFAPRWIDPIGREKLGDEMTMDMATRMDAARYPVIWEVSERGHHAHEVRGLKVTRVEQAGALTITRYVQKPAELVYDFGEHLASAHVDGRAQGRPRLSLEEVGFEPHRCIRVEPRPGEKVTLTFSAAPLGRTLVGYVGLADVFTRRDIRTPISLEVLVNGEVVATTRAGVDDGFVRFEVSTQPGTADVSFVLAARSPKRIGCLAVEARE